MQVKIPFNDWSKERLFYGDKVATSRNQKYGKKGDTFWVGKRLYKIEFIVKLPLWFIKEHLYKSEGAESPDEFENIWANIHPVVGFKKYQEVWYHCFALV